MSGRAIKSLVLFSLVIGAALYVVGYNDTSSTLTLSKNWSITAPSGFIYIGTFVAGMLVCSLFAAFFGLRASRELPKARNVRCQA